MITKKYMCPDCYKLFTESKATEMKFKHHCHKAYDGNYLIPIDEPIAEAISLMNQKGYPTKYCCSGHWGDEGIIFNNIMEFYVDFEVSIYALPYLLSHPPIGLIISCNINNIEYLRYGMIPMHISAEERGMPMYSIDMCDDTQITEDLYESSQKWADEVYTFSLKKWVEMLPEASSFNKK